MGRRRCTYVNEGFDSCGEGIRKQFLHKSYDMGYWLLASVDNCISLVLGYTQKLH